MRRMQLRVIGSNDTVATFDLVIVKEDGTEYEAGPDDHYEPFLLGDAVMRVYIRNGKKVAKEDIAFIVQWIYRYAGRNRIEDGLGDLKMMQPGLRYGLASTLISEADGTMLGVKPCPPE